MSQVTGTARAGAASAIDTPITAHPYRFFGSYRFMLALLVLTSHASGMLSETYARLSTGNVGVLSFFMLSGAVICEALDIFYRDASKRFLINRALKIFPAYWAALVVYALCIALLAPELLSFDPWTVLVNVSLLLSYLPKGNSLLIVDIGWAVVVECQFYLVAAGLFFVAHRTRNPGVVLYIGAIIALCMYVFVHVTHGQNRFYGSFRFAPYFVLGSVVYFAITRRDWRIHALAMVAAVMALHAYVNYALASPRGGLPFHLSAYDFGVVGSTLLFIAAVGAFLWAIRYRAYGAVEWLDKRLGDITYAIYLIHPLMIFVAVRTDLPGRIGNGGAFLFVLTASLILAIAIFRSVERPVMRLRNRFRGQRLYD